MHKNIFWAERDTLRTKHRKAFRASARKPRGCGFIPSFIRCRGKKSVANNTTGLGRRLLLQPDNHRLRIHARTSMAFSFARMSFLSLSGRRFSMHIFLPHFNASHHVRAKYFPSVSAVELAGPIGTRKKQAPSRDIPPPVHRTHASVRKLFQAGNNQS